MYEIFYERLELTPQEVAALLTLEPATMLATPVARRVIDSISFPVLRASLPEAQELMKRALPDFYTWLVQDLAVTRIPTSPDHAIEWIGDFLLQQREIADLIDTHMGLSANVLALATPRFVNVFSDLSFGREQWQRATALLCLVLLVAAQRHGHANPTA